MRVNRFLIPILALVGLFGTVFVAQATGNFATNGREGTDLARLTPADLKGWMTLQDVMNGLGISQTDLYAAGNIPSRSTGGSSPARLCRASRCRAALGQAGTGGPARGHPQHWQRRQHDLVWRRAMRLCSIAVLAVAVAWSGCGVKHIRSARSFVEPRLFASNNSSHLCHLAHTDHRVTGQFFPTRSFGCNHRMVASPKITLRVYTGELSAGFDDEQHGYEFYQ